ncbi:MAG TPA: hypothetical protein DEB39_03645 [Planctomycetaceae bacterium]|nr:hypothetical protein [Planctomycetaceae bacterium]
MNTSEVRLGQCYFAKLSERSTQVRIERTSPGGGWIARVLSHGKHAKIKNAAQLLRHCDEDEIAAVVRGLEPNRRSLIEPVTELPPFAFENKDGEILATPPTPKRIKIAEPPPESMSLLDAAAYVLKSAKKALSTREIVAAIIQQRLWNPSGATPWATLNAALNRDMQANGTKSRFVKAERGKYSLR